MDKPVTDDELNAAAAAAEAAETGTPAVSQAPPEPPPGEEPPKESVPAVPPSEPPVPAAEPPEPVAQEPAQAPPAAEPPKASDEPDAEGLTPADRSALGRKVARLERRIEELLDKEPEPAPVQPVASEEPVEVPTTIDEMDRYLDQRDARRNNARVTYETGFIQETAQLAGDRDPEEHKAIMQELLDNKSINQIVTKNPVTDAQIAYSKAEAVYFKKKAAAPAVRQNPLKGDPPTGPTGVNGGTQNTVPAAPVVKLDAAAEDFIKYTGQSREDASKTIKESKFPMASKPI